MLKRLDKYMDNLKSPYWEPILYFIFFICVFSSIITILTASPDLAGKLGNTGSFLGGVIAVLAFCLGVKEYLKYTRHRGFHDLNRLKNELLPTFEIEFSLNQSNLLVLISNIAKYENAEIARENIKNIDVLAVKNYFVDLHLKVETSLDMVISASPHLKFDLEAIRDEFKNTILVWEHAAIFCYNFQDEKILSCVETKHRKQFLYELNKSEIYAAFTENNNKGSEVFRKYSEELLGLISKIKGLN